MRYNLHRYAHSNGDFGNSQQTASLDASSIHKMLVVVANNRDYWNLYNMLSHQFKDTFKCF